MMKKEGVIKFLTYCSWLLLVAATIIDLFKNPYRSIIWVFSLALLLFFYFRLKVPLYIHLLLSFMAVLNILGETIFEWYYLFMHYDKLLHLINPVIGCLFVYHLAKNKIKDKKLLVMFCVFTVLSLAVGWEIFEYGFDNFFTDVMQGVQLKYEGHFFGFKEVMNKFDDTMLDFIYAAIGTLIFALVFWIKNITKGKE